MKAVESSARLCCLTGASNARLFAKPIESTDKLLVPSITITEVFDSALRQRNEESALEVIAHMKHGTAVAMAGELAINAAVFGVELKLPLVDSIIYATAQKYDAVVRSQDADFKGLESVEFNPKTKFK